MHDRIPVKVWLRSVASIRGTLTGTLVAYDKHMNMVR
jgi:small nuclear ribonucleoprotein (snRNP)-like protein